MKKYNKLIPILLVTFAFVSNVEAGWGRNKNQSSNQKEDPCGCAIRFSDCPPTVAGYSAPGRWNPCEDWDIFLSGSYIYWHVSEECLDIGQATNANVPGKRTMVAPDFDYHSGFKIELGTNLNHDNWTGLLRYTRLHTSDTTAFENVVVGGRLEISDWWEIPGGPVDGTQVNNVRSRWECDLDMLDVEFARDYYLGYMLIVRPFMGPRVVWLDQKYNTGLVPLNAPAFPNNLFTARWTSDSWSIGPRAGCDLNWELGCGFRFVGSAAASLLYREHKVRGASPNATNPHAISIVRRNTYRFIKPQTDFSMGMAWGTYFSDQAYHFDLLAAYEFLLWWNENLMRHTADTLDTDIFSKPSDLSYHGLTVKLRLDF